ncbi:Regulator of G-protein signaling 3 [Dissostichus eleginoides]|uniref:Regulator of G-protein signaling 3 n=1 Tax=Dissostichus eleginoides TaxID=100907 RepID=A0AAD9B3S8_DISEL|nr:Regulator of G-protein signaling 3 [Dissostichus eleginoides]
MGKSQRSCDSFVELAVTYDLSIRMKTATIHNKNPEYRTTHTLRLLVSVLSRRRQLIGCMSFGIGSLVSSSQLITGWFYLLGEEFGRSKHLRVTSQRSRPMRSQEEVQVNLVLYGGISPLRGSALRGDQSSTGGSVLYGDQSSTGGSVLYGDQSSTGGSVLYGDQSSTGGISPLRGVSPLRGSVLYGGSVL